MALCKPCRNVRAYPPALGMLDDHGRRKPSETPCGWLKNGMVIIAANHIGSIQAPGRWRRRWRCFVQFVSIVERDLGIERLQQLLRVRRFRLQSDIVQ